MMSLKYQLNIKDWDRITIPVYEKLVLESKERFEEVSDLSQVITKRGITIFTLAGVASGFLIPRLGSSGLDTSIWIVIAVLFISSIALMWPRNTKWKGTLYEEVVTPELTEDTNEIEQLRVYYCSQLQILHSWCKSMVIGNTWRIYLFQFCQLIILVLLGLLFSKFTQL